MASPEDMARIVALWDAIQKEIDALPYEVAAPIHGTISGLLARELQGPLGEYDPAFGAGYVIGQRVKLVLEQSVAIDPEGAIGQIRDLVSE